MKQAAECMGLPGPSAVDLENLTKRFCDDILKIELSGPDHHHLSVVDVPGLFHSNWRRCSSYHDVYAND